MATMQRYFKWSLGLHAALLVALLVWTFAASSRQKRTMELVILPKGTSLDSHLTKEVVDAIENPDGTAKSNDAPSPTPQSSPSPAPTPEPVQDMVIPPLATPSPTPIRLATPTPEPTAAPTAIPEKTMTVPPKATPTPRLTPKPSPSPSPKKTPTPTPKPAKQTPKPGKPTPKGGRAKATPTPKPKPRPPGSVYDLPPDTASNPLAGANLPRQTPANAKVVDAAPDQEVGVPGIAEGVEGAPLPLDRTQSGVSMLYATRARMRIQTNFTVPPGVDDPNMTCVLEWEILPDGTIQNGRVVKSTGTAQYDACAIDALNKTANLGALPPEFGGRSIWTSLTFVYAGNQAP